MLPPAQLPNLIRYRVIDQCLRRPGIWSWKELSAACGEALRENLGDHIPDPVERTIKKDIQVLRSGKLGLRAPIVYDRKRKSYRYEGDEFTLDQPHLPMRDLKTLVRVQQLINQFPELEHTRHVNDLVERLSLAMDIRLQAGPPTLLFDEPLSEGQHWLTPLHQAVREKQAVRLDYHPFYEPSPITFVVSPYLLKEFNGRWFLIAMDHREGRISNYPLDRIQSAEVHLLESFRPAPGKKMEDHFRHVVGVSIPRDGSMEKIELWVRNDLAGYIRTKPIHRSQVILSEEEDGITIRLKLIPNYELESVILSHGEKIQVLEPKWLGEKIAGRLEEARNRYA
jgi:predicted DNA-binding transcriptional regulator YafY